MLGPGVVVSQLRLSTIDGLCDSGLDCKIAYLSTRTVLEELLLDAWCLLVCLSVVVVRESCCSNAVVDKLIT